MHLYFKVIKYVSSNQLVTVHCVHYTHVMGGGGSFEKNKTKKKKEKHKQQPVIEPIMVIMLYLGMTHRSDEDDHKMASDMTPFKKKSHIQLMPDQDFKLATVA